MHAAIIRRLGPLGEPIRLSSDEGNYKKVRNLIGGCVADSINCLVVFPAVSHGTKSTDLSCGECTGVFADALLYTRSAENVSCIENSGVSNTCNKRARRNDRIPDALISRKRKFLCHLQHTIGCGGSETGSVSDHPNAFFAYPHSNNKQSRELSPPRFNLHYSRQGSAVSSQFSLEDAAIVAELNAIPNGRHHSVSSTCLTPVPVMPVAVEVMNHTVLTPSSDSLAKPLARACSVHG